MWNIFKLIKVIELQDSSMIKWITESSEARIQHRSVQAYTHWYSCVMKTKKCETSVAIIKARCTKCRTFVQNIEQLTHAKRVRQHWWKANNKPFHLPKRCRLPFSTGVTSSTERRYIGALVICDFRGQRSVSSLKKKKKKKEETFSDFFACSHFIQEFHLQLI